MKKNERTNKKKNNWKTEWVKATENEVETAATAVENKQ